jgi:hypothetical protein
MQSRIFPSGMRTKRGKFLWKWESLCRARSHVHDDDDENDDCVLRGCCWKWGILNSDTHSHANCCPFNGTHGILMVIYVAFYCSLFLTTTTHSLARLPTTKNKKFFIIVKLYNWTDDDYLDFKTKSSKNKNFSGLFFFFFLLLAFEKIHTHAASFIFWSLFHRFHVLAYTYVCEREKKILKLFSWIFSSFFFKKKNMTWGRRRKVNEYLMREVAS